MNLEDRSSYLLMACALLLARQQKCSLESSLQLVPLSDRVRRLANHMVAVPSALGNSHAAEITGSQQNEDECVANAGVSWRPLFDDSAERSAPVFSTRHVAPTGALAAIELTPAHLRCPVCGNQGTFLLDAWQVEHLQIRGHLEMYCGYCGANSLWEPAEAPEQELSRIVL
jgi:hypothetical protein